MIQQQQYSLTWHTYPDHLKNMMQEMMTSEDFTDVTLVSDDKKSFKAHRCILSSCSPVFKNILQMEKQNNPVIYLRGVKYSEILSILQYIYLGEARFCDDQDQMKEFLLVAKNLEIKELCTFSDSECSDLRKGTSTNTGIECKKLGIENTSDNNIKEFLSVEENLSNEKPGTDIELHPDPSQLQPAVNISDGMHKKVTKFIGNYQPIMPLLVPAPAPVCIKGCGSQFTNVLHLERHQKVCTYSKPHTTQSDPQPLASTVSCALPVLPKQEEQIQIEQLPKNWEYGDNLDIAMDENLEDNAAEGNMMDDENLNDNIDNSDELNRTDDEAEIQQRYKEIDKKKKKKNACNQCDYVPKYRYQLIKHIQSVHEGIKFPCNQCDYIGAHKTNLQRHVQSIHADRKSPCNQCDYQATTSDSLKRHKQIYHKQIQPVQYIKRFTQSS